ncbi:MAG: aldo/keto reductase [Alphaproteobacteria bacterium]|nr:aldo/keto reductase [Alphaproteobacteria bacterium]
MQFRNLGRSGLQVSLVGVGCNNFGQRLDQAGTDAVVHAALDAGITLFDTADIYGGGGKSEELLGKSLGTRRKDIVLASKFGMRMADGPYGIGAARHYIMHAVEASLQRLGTDWIDLYQLHQPDPLTPIEETLRALDDLIRQGKVRYIGHSNFAAWQTVEAELTSGMHGLNAFVSAQDEYSLVMRGLEDDRLAMMEKYDLGLLPFFPLASGLLTGKHGDRPLAGTRMADTSRFMDRYWTDANLAIVRALTAFAQERGRTMLELAMSWLATRPQVSSVIAGAMTPKQIATNAVACDWAMDADERAAIDEILNRA